MRKRSISFMLVLLMMLLPACSESDVNNESEKPEETVSQPGETAETEPEIDELAAFHAAPEGDFEGHIFRTAAHDVHWIIHDQITAEEENGEVLNDAFYARQIAVEDKLNIGFESQFGVDAYNYILQQVRAQTDDFDAVWVDTVPAFTLAKVGMSYDLSTIEVIDFDADYWAPAYNDLVNIGSKRYAVYGDIHLGYHSAHFVVAYNKDILEQYPDMKSPYDLVKEDKWTWDALNEMSVGVYRDIDGNGESTLAKDQFGMTMHQNQLVYFQMSSGVQLLDKDENGMLYWNGVSEKFVDGFNRVGEILTKGNHNVVESITPGYSAYASSVLSSGLEGYTHIFSEGRALFNINAIGTYEYYRESDIDYGLVYFPKYEETQDRYYPVLYGHFHTLAAPSNMPDPERTGIILENLSAYSSATLKKSFIESVVYYKYARDAQTVEILEDLFSLGSYSDVAFIHNWGGVSGVVENLHSSGRGSIASVMQSISKKITSQLEDALEYLQ
ncbi:MAG: extracellular solute-binding protein [Clostridia bacterium]|nr:extracellular solute-binding protein [Clostridia bacterium]